MNSSSVLYRIRLATDPGFAQGAGTCALGDLLRLPGGGEAGKLRIDGGHPDTFRHVLAGDGGVRAGNEEGCDSLRTDHSADCTGCSQTSVPNLPSPHRSLVHCQWLGVDASAGGVES